MKMLMFDFRESEKKIYKEDNYDDFEITFLEEPLNEKTNLSQALMDETDVISVFTTSSVTENVIKKFKNLRVIATRSTGFDHIDIGYCQKHHIRVLNVEEYGKTSVAEFTISLIMTLIRKIVPSYLDIKQNKINQPLYEGKSLKEVTLGIIGSGSIGSSVARLAHLLGMNVIVHSLVKNEEISQFVKYVSLNDLLRQSDVITLHSPFNKDNYHMLGEEEFKLMKEGVYVVNTARGELIDIVALYEALNSGKVKGAALDVLECEFLAFNKSDILTNVSDIDKACITSALITSKLLENNNVIITPHIAYNTSESVKILLETTFNNIKDYYKGLHTNQVC